MISNHHQPTRKVIHSDFATGQNPIFDPSPEGWRQNLEFAPRKTVDRTDWVMRSFLTCHLFFLGPFSEFVYREVNELWRRRREQARLINKSHRKAMGIIYKSKQKP